MRRRDAALLLAAGALALAQNQSTPIIRIDVNVVQVDAVVTDSRNRHVADLTADDFIVLQDGKPQTISNFSYIATAKPTVPTAPGPAAVRGAVAAPPPLVPLKASEVRRTFALVVDDLGLAFNSIAFVRDALRKFVDQQMQPGDLVAIIRTSAGLGVLQQFTTDKNLLHAAIDRVKFFANGRVGVDSFGPAGQIDDPNEVYPASGPTRSLSPASLDPSADQSRTQMFTVGTLGAIQYVIEGLRDMPGRKSVLLFSENLQLHDLEPGLLPAPMSGGGGPTVFVEQITQGMQYLVDAANRASVVIYTIDPRGVVPLFPGAVDRVSGRGRTVANLMSSREAQLFKSREGLWTLAEETGGLFIHDDNFIDDAIKQAVADTEGYYLIGYHPDSETFDAKTGQAKFHRLEVKLKKPGLHVRSRSGFFGQSDAEARNIPRSGHEELIHALTSPFSSGDVHVRLTALFEQSADRPFIRALLHIDAGDLKFTAQPDGGQKAALEVEAMTFGESGQPADQSDHHFGIALNPQQYAGARKYGLVYRVDQPLQHAGMYQVRVALRDEDSGRLGSASQFMETPDVSKGRLALSSLLLAENTSQTNARDSDPATSAADRVFKPGEALSYQYTIFNAQTDPAGHTDLHVQTRIFRDGRLVYEGQPIVPELAAQNDTKRLVAGGNMVLAKAIPPGDYILQVTVTDKLAKEKYGSAAQWMDFEIAGAAIH